FLFVQAEDGIRDFHVTGVQTCALPILGIDPERVYAAKELKALKETARRAEDAPAVLRKVHKKSTTPDPLRGLFETTIAGKPVVRSEERRVGIERRRRRSPEDGRRNAKV